MVGFRSGLENTQDELPISCHTRYQRLLGSRQKDSGTNTKSSLLAKDGKI